MSFNVSQNGWYEAAETELRRLVQERVPNPEIQRRLGCGRNQLAGKLNRLGLTNGERCGGRVKRGFTPDELTSIERLCRDGISNLGISLRLGITEWRVAEIRRASGWPPSSRAQANSSIRSGVAAHRRLMKAVGPGCVERPQIVAPARQAPAVTPRLSLEACCWPIGDPGTREFRYCDDPALFGKPYCEDHAKVAYLRRKVEVAA